MAKITLDPEADIRPISDFRANAAAMLAQIRETGRPMVLTRRGRGAVVVLDIAAYGELLNELEELRDVQRGLADIEAGRVVDHEDVEARLAERLKD